MGECGGNDRIDIARPATDKVGELTDRGAGGKNADLTSSLVQVCQETIGIETCMHLCCTESEYYIYIYDQGCATELMGSAC